MPRQKSEGFLQTIRIGRVYIGLTKADILEATDNPQIKLNQVKMYISIKYFYTSKSYDRKIRTDSPYAMAKISIEMGNALEMYMVIK